jgi:hypothetical protein
MLELLMKIRFVRRQARCLEKKRIRKQIRDSASAEEAREANTVLPCVFFPVAMLDGDRAL